MNVESILSQIDAEIAKLQQARAALVGGGAVSSGNGHRRRTLSAEARAKIAAAQKRRWAKVRKAAK